MKKTAFAIFLSILSLNSFSADYRVQRVKVLGPFNNKVIFQSKALKKVRGSNVLKGRIVVQWGLHVFEVGNGIYACNRNNYCKFMDFERLATFEQCTVRGNNKVECRNRLNGGRFTPTSPEIVVHDSPDSTRDDLHRDPRYTQDTDFPVRILDEFDGVF